MPPPPDLRSSVAALLEGGSAHATLAQGVRGLPPALAGKRPSGAAHSAWELVEHIRIAQRDILEYTRNPTHVSPPFPAGYWPASATPPSAAAWNKARRAVLSDLADMVALVRDPGVDLLAPLPHAPEHNVLREALVLADHNAYHLGQLVALRRRLGCWRG